jgi:hypothetical protein
MAMRLWVFCGGYHWLTICLRVSVVLGLCHGNCSDSLTQIAPGKNPALKSTLAWQWNMSWKKLTRRRRVGIGSPAVRQSSVQPQSKSSPVKSQPSIWRNNSAAWTLTIPQDTTSVPMYQLALLNFANRRFEGTSNRTYGTKKTFFSC